MHVDEIGMCENDFLDSHSEAISIKWWIPNFNERLQ
jgi:hypothetical protein